MDVPKKILLTKNKNKVHKIIFNNRKVQLIEIAETQKMSKKHVQHIVNECFSMQKFCSKWLSRELKINKKQQQIYDSEQKTRFL